MRFFFTQVSLFVIMAACLRPSEWSKNAKDIRNYGIDCTLHPPESSYTGVNDHVYLQLYLILFKELPHLQIQRPAHQ